MTPYAKAVVALYGLAFVVMGYVAALDALEDDWVSAGVLYGSAAIAGTSAYREIERSLPDEEPRPGDWPDTEACDDELDAVVDDEIPPNCTCELWWMTLGRHHAQDCPAFRHTTA